MSYEFFSESTFNPLTEHNMMQNDFSQVVPQTKMEIIPGGVSYTFVSTIPNCSYQSFPIKSFQNMQPTQPTLTIQQQIAMKQLELQQLQNVLLQELENKPYENKFHFNKKMSTSEIFEQTYRKQIEEGTQSANIKGKNETGIQVLIRSEMKDSTTSTKENKHCCCKSTSLKQVKILDKAEKGIQTSSEKEAPNPSKSKKAR